MHYLHPTSIEVSEFLKPELYILHQSIIPLEIHALIVPSVIYNLPLVQLPAYWVIPFTKGLYCPYNETPKQLSEVAVTN